MVQQSNTATEIDDIGQQRIETARDDRLSPLYLGSDTTTDELLDLSTYHWWMHRTSPETPDQQFRAATPLHREKPETEG